MNIWIVSHYAAPFARYGNTRHVSLALALNNMGHRVVVIASSFGHRTGEEVRIPRGCNTMSEVIDGVQFVWVRSPPYRGNGVRRIWNMLVFAWRTFFWGRATSDSVDVVLGSSPDLFGAFAGERLARARRVPFILEIRDLWPETWRAMGISSRHPVVLVAAVLESFLYRRADRIVTTLRGADAYVRRIVATAKIDWLPNGVDVSKLPDRSPPPDGGHFRFVYAGGHGQSNSLHDIVSAVAELNARSGTPRFVVDFYGDGPEKGELMARAQQLGLRNLRFHSPVGKSEVRGVIAAADACLLAHPPLDLYRWGISPNKLFDYMGTSRPVVIATNAAFDAVTEAQAGIRVTPGDVKSIADGMLKMMLLSSDQRREFGESGRRYVEENHDLRRIAERLNRLIEDVCCC